MSQQQSNGAPSRAAEAADEWLAQVGIAGEHRDSLIACIDSAIAKAFADNSGPMPTDTADLLLDYFSAEAVITPQGELKVGPTVHLATAKLHCRKAEELLIRAMRDFETMERLPEMRRAVRTAAKLGSVIEGIEELKQPT